MLQLVCECGRRLQVDESHAGKRGRCSCGRELAIPKLASSDTRSRLNANEGTYTSGGQRIELASSLRSQQTLGQFVVLRKLGEGAMGEVWLAKDKRLGREVAIKVLPDDLRRDPERRQRFEREAKVMAKLHHPHTVTVHQLGEDDNLLYLVMEFVGGGSLADRVCTSGPLPWLDATRAIRDTAAGLAEAHLLGLVHRDIKPANLLQSVDGVTKVGDFGLARAVIQDTQLTQQGGVLGTPSYMAPEQWEGKKADAKSDLYALICSYYFLLTGKPPFDAENWLALGLQHRNDPFPDPRQSVADIPKSVVDTLAHGSQKDPAKRFQTADELIAQLDEILITAPNTDPPRTFPHRIAAMVKETAKWLTAGIFPASRYPRIPRWASIAAGGAALLFLVAIVFFVRTPHGTLRIEVNDPQIEVSEEQQAIAGLKTKYRETLEIGSKDEKAKLAQELLLVAEKQDETPARRLAYLRVGGPLAFEAGIFDKPFATCDLIAKQIESHDSLDLRTDLLHESANKSMELHAQAFAEAALQIGFRCLALDKLQNAEVLAADIARAVKKCDREELVYQVGFLADECRHLKPLYEHFKTYSQVHQLNPSDAKAKLEMGKYYCFGKNDWQKGLPFIVAGNDLGLSVIAMKDLDRLDQESGGKPSDVDGLLKLADLWWDIADKIDKIEANGYRQRAKYWYLKALGQSDPERRKLLSGRVLPRIDSLPSRPVSLRIRANGVEGKHHIRISNDGIHAWNTHGTRGVRINHLEVAGQFQYKNMSSQYLIPAVVDFSSVDVRHEWTGNGRWGQINDYDIRPDYIQVNFEHGPGGKCDFEVFLRIDADGFQAADRFTNRWDVKFYNWEQDDIPTDDGWEKVISRDWADHLQMERPYFRAGNQAFSSRHSPSPKLQGLQRWDKFALVATRDWELSDGEYEIHTLSDDGIRVIVDGRKLLDNPNRSENTGRIQLEAGKHPIRVEYFDHGGSAHLTFSLRRL